MKKEATRDYATNAFRNYALEGRPTYEALRKKLYDRELSKHIKLDPLQAVIKAENAVKNKEPYLLDIMAVDKTMKLLRKGDKSHIAEAIECVYFVLPSQPLRKGDITERVRHFSVEQFVDERTAYRWLKKARDLFSSIRGLNMNSDIVNTN